jgi:hypothetical protein
MNNYTSGQINIYCQSVFSGCKPCALFPLQDRYVEEVKKQINGNALFVYAEFLYEGWQTVWIYKLSFMLEIIKALPKEPKSAFDHWVLGKAFGYSDSQISEYIRFKVNSNFSEPCAVTSGAGRQSVSIII